MGSSAQGHEGSSGRLADSLFMLESARFAQQAPADPADLVAQHALAVHYSAAGRYTDAVALFQDVARRSRLIMGPTHVDTLVAEGNLAVTYAALEQWDRAIPALEAAADTRSSVLGPEHPATAIAFGALATALQITGQTVRARTLHQYVIDHRRTSLGPAHRDTLTARLGLALTFADEGNTDTAVMQLAAAVADAEAASAELPPLLLALLRTHLGLCLADLGQRERAGTVVREAIEELSAATSPHDADVIELRHSVLAVGA